MKHQRGFTLIEIMVVVVIIGLLAAFIVPQITGKVEQARVAKAKTDIQALDTALSMYKLDNFHYPPADAGLAALMIQPTGDAAKNWKGPYLKKLSRDPWNNDYQYVVPGKHGEYDLYSRGADGQDEGEGENADIGNWNIE
jgi:general secretion pathway protein G